MKLSEEEERQAEIVAEGLTKAIGKMPVDPIVSVVAAGMIRAVWTIAIAVGVVIVAIWIIKSVF